MLKRIGRAASVLCAAAATAALAGAGPADAATSRQAPRPVPTRIPVYVPAPLPVDPRPPILAALQADQRLLLDTHTQAAASIAASDRKLSALGAEGAKRGDAAVSARVASREARELDVRIARAQAIRTRLDASLARLDDLFSQIQIQTGGLYARPAADAQADAGSLGRELLGAVDAALAAVGAEAAFEAADAGFAGGGGMSWPEAAFEVSQGFGPSELPGEPPFGGFDHFHLGIDLAAPEGTPVIAPAGGVVMLTGTPTPFGRYAGFGNYAVVDFGGGLTAIFGHLEEVHVSAGDHLRRGQTIGLEGSTGYSTGPHLHFELHSEGRPVDPAPYMK